MRAKGAGAGFTLLEMSIVLVIIAIVTGGGLAILVAAANTTQFNATVARMDSIQKALLNYRVAFARIPCPADETLTTASGSYGAEAAVAGSCIGGTPAANRSGSLVAEGTVPTAALRLPDDYMYDSWGRRFHYAVTQGLTASGAFSGATCPAGAITINDASESARTTGAAYALVSHGQNGHGGYTSNGVMFNGGSTNNDEQTNCHCNSAGSLTTYSGTYVEKLPALNTSSPFNSFDDIVAYALPSQLQAPSTYASASACNTNYFVYVVDQANYRIEQFSTTGSFISQWPCASGACASGSFGTGIYYLQGMSTDANGNFYLGDAVGSWIVDKFNSSGSFVAQVGPSLTYGNTTNYTRSNQAQPNIARDPSGNFWVGDGGNNRVLEYNSSGSWLLTIPPSGCNTAGSFPMCPSQTNVQGQVPGAYGPTVDGSGNVYVEVNGNNFTIQKFNSSGSFVTWFNTYDPSGSLSGYMGDATIWAFDSSGNFWANNGYFDNVTKWNSSGTLLFQIGNLAGHPGCCPTGCNASNTPNGQFCGPEGMTLDPSGNIWVTDQYNNRVQEFTSSGSWLLTIPRTGCQTSSIPACTGSSASGSFNFSNNLDANPPFIAVVNTGTAR